MLSFRVWTPKVLPVNPPDTPHGARAASALYFAADWNVSQADFYANAATAAQWAYPGQTVTAGSNPMAYSWIAQTTINCIRAPNDATTSGLARYYVEDALGMWEPRIDVTEVLVAPDPGNSGRLLIEIRYQIKSTHDERALVFPFYRIPGEESE